MQKDLDENSYEKRIENIEKGKSYLKSNGFLNQNLIYSKTYKNLFIKGNLKKIFYFWLIKSLNKQAIT